ncbi:endonuclease/exonuclease/phosphatase family protein [Aestuariimicrobium ganziense]|uniref:endonuclease/exonuclease/phosphatase family protein n=1 Tax=Aestuariimicrobium ganziense TaxID=2773677 RepID=UPI00194335A5|nr:endonuclease/exonuclease/phosphatase family protein [Aestuariimicrobium ganziense]
MRRPGRILAVLAFVAATAVVGVFTFPRASGLSMVTPIGQLVAFRTLLLALTLVALVVAVLVWVVLLVRQVRARRAGRGVGSFGAVMASLMVVVLTCSVAVHGAVVWSRGGVGDAPATIEQIASSPVGDDDFTVVSLNSLWDEVDPAWIARLAHGSRATMVALPESERDHAEKVAAELAALGEPGWQVFAVSSPWPNALLVSPQAGEYRVREGLQRGLVIADPVGHDGPVLMTVHAVPPPSVPPWHREHAVWSRSWRGTVSNASQAIRAERHVVAAGDFNATLDHAALDPGVRPATVGTNAMGTWPSSWPTWAGARIDHVFAKPYDASRGSWVVDSPGSDHRAVVVRLTYAR